MITQRCRSAKAESGLTLIELCVAVALLAVIATMSYRGLDSMSRTSDRTLAEGERWQAIALFFERLAADVSQAALRPVRDANDAGPARLTPQANWVMTAAGMQPPAEAKGLPAWWGRPLPPLAPDSAATNFDCPLEFTRKSASGRDDIRLGYRLRDDHLELLIWHVLDRAPSSQPEVFSLLEGVGTLHFRHLDAAGIWQESWPLSDSSDPLPRAIEVELTMKDGTLLHRVFALPS
ncbi:MAG: type II secretion system protein GspJ [Nevskiales bacterium]